MINCDVGSILHGFRDFRPKKDAWTDSKASISHTVDGKQITELYSTVGQTKTKKSRNTMVSVT